ncbi:hypothetical protein, partial [Schleiferilactobacillus harbinensis]|uniref:hypothetical protein n=1 Tax=Schleiferilactobacillus harbinensis TaxID=304207 RepID=UPI0021A3EC49
PHLLGEVSNTSKTAQLKELRRFLFKRKFIWVLFRQSTDIYIGRQQMSSRSTCGRHVATGAFVYRLLLSPNTYYNAGFRAVSNESRQNREGVPSALPSLFVWDC